jgi:hypothetical protein
LRRSGDPAIAGRNNEISTMARAEEAAATRDAAAASAGKIQLLDLAALKNRIGSKWERMAGPVQKFFEGAIRRHLGPGDMFYHADELSYLVVFRDLSEAETDLKCTAISEEICQRLFGENGESVTLRNLVGKIRLPANGLNNAEQRAINERLEREGREILVTKGASSNASQHRPPERELCVTLGDAMGSQRRIVSTDVAFVYRPIWDCAKHAVLTYLAQPVLRTAVPPANEQDSFLSVHDPEDAAFLDLMALEECTSRVKLLRGAGMRIILAVPVHFDTIARSRLWEGYSARYRALPKDVSRDLAFIISGIESGVPHIRLVQELPKLALTAFRVFCLVDSVDGLRDRFARSGANGVGVALSHFQPEVHAAKVVADIAREAHAVAIDSFALGVTATSLALRAIDAGIRYLEGSTIRPSVSDPRHAFLHDVEDLYRSLRGSGSHTVPR